MKGLGKKFLSSFLVSLFVVPQFSFASGDFQSKEKSVVRAYKRVSISLASSEFNDIQRGQYLEAFKTVLAESEVTKEEFEKIALANKWVPENFDFSAEFNIRHIEPYGTAFTIKETLMDLPQEDFLEDSLFKIVLSRGEQLSEEPQEITPHTYHISDWEEFVPNKTGWFRDRVAKVSDANLDAENVFYYLHVARNALLERFGERLRGLHHPQMIARVGMTSEYNMYLKFSDEETYNGAVTVGDPALDGPGIWFYLPKRVPKESFWAWSPIHRYLFKNTALMTEAPAFDAAKIAEVIFHEYGHVVTAPY